MSTTGATVHTTNAVSLADEEEVKQVLLNSVLGLWDVVERPYAAQAVPARSLSRHHLRLGAGAGGNVRLRRDQAGGSGAGRDGLRHYHRRRPIDSIKKRGVLRVGVLADRLPFVFLNGEGQLVGFNIEMAQLLAGDLGVKVEFIEMEDLKALPRLLATGRIDLAMPGVAVTPERASEMLFSEPYLDETLAFVVKDQLREEFSNWATIRDLGAFPVGVLDLPYYIDRVKTRAPALKLQVVESIKQIEDGLKKGTFDAVVLPAERGSVLTLLYPKYTVVVP